MFMKRVKRKIEEIEVSLGKVCVDTSALIQGKVTELMNSNKLDGSEIIIPEIVIGELQAQAAKGKEIGFVGLEEIKKIQQAKDKHNITLRFFGEKPSYEDILLSKSGRIDALIQDVAKKSDAVLITCDLLQALVAQAQGIKVKYFESYVKKNRIKIESFLTQDTMSLHLKEGAIPYAKRGKPGDMKLVSIRNKPMIFEEMNEIATEILESARYEDDSFVELGEYGATVIQLKDKRISIAKPPAVPEPFTDASHVPPAAP